MNFNQILVIAKIIKIPVKDIDAITEYLDHVEWGIAFETLCSAIEQDKIEISANEYVLIKEIGEYMNMDERLWEVFKV